MDHVAALFLSPQSPHIADSKPKAFNGRKAVGATRTLRFIGFRPYAWQTRAKTPNLKAQDPPSYICTT